MSAMGPWPGIESSALRSGLKTGKRLEKNRTRTSLLKTAVLVFSNFKIKDRKRPVYMDRLRPVKTGFLYSLITPSN